MERLCFRKKESWLMTQPSLDAPHLSNNWSLFTACVRKNKFFKASKRLGIVTILTESTLGYSTCWVFFRQAFVWFTRGWHCKLESLWMLGLGSKIGLEMDRVIEKWERYIEGWNDLLIYCLFTDFRSFITSWKCWRSFTIIEICPGNESGLTTNC